MYYANNAEYQAARPRTPTQEDVEKQLKKNEIMNEKIMAAEKARLRWRANLTVEQRLQVIENYLETRNPLFAQEAWMFRGNLDRPLDAPKVQLDTVDREEILRELQSEHRQELKSWQRDDPGEFAFRIGAASVVDNVFAKFYQ